MLFNAHSDFGINVYRRTLQGDNSSLLDAYYEALKRGNVKIEIMTVGGDFTLGGIDFRDTDIVLETIKAVKMQISKSDERFRLIETAEDFENVETTDSIGIILGLEGASPLKTGSISIKDFYEVGIRSLILTSNEKNDFAGGCLTPSIGLSSKGKNLIELLNDIPIAIDLSHISEKAFIDVFDITDKALIVSHANARAISNHSRNLTDKQIELIQNRKGVIGLSLISLFIDKNEENQTSINKFLEHVEYIINLVGIEALGIGADFMDYIEDIAIPFFVKIGCPKSITTYPKGISSIADVNVIFKQMVERGFNTNEIHKFAYSNFANCFKKQLKAN